MKVVEDVDDYDPKSKNNRLTRFEKSVIFCGSAIFVFLLVLYMHPGILIANNNGSQIESPSFEELADVKQSTAVDSHLLWPGYATSEGTSSFSRLHLSGQGHFHQSHSNLQFSDIGIGSYLGDHTPEVDLQLEEAVYDSVRAGVNVIDTAINYRGMKSERSIGNALSKLFREKIASRDNLFISTKAGFIPSDADSHVSTSRTAANWIAESHNKLSQVEIIEGKHCIAPLCLNQSIQASMKNLGLQTIDLLYLHNVAEKQGPVLSSAELMARLREAFQFIEGARARGQIRFYGLATWQCFRVPQSSPLYLSLRAVVALAAEVGGGADAHGFRFVQLPVTLSMSEGATALYQEDKTLLALAQELGVSVVSSRSIAASRPELLSAMEAVHQTCVSSQAQQQQQQGDELTGAPLLLHMTRSVPGLLSALVGMKAPLHVQQNLRLLTLPPASAALAACYMASLPSHDQHTPLDNAAHFGHEDAHERQRQAKPHDKAGKINKKSGRLRHRAPDRSADHSADRTTTTPDSE